MTARKRRRQGLFVVGGLFLAIQQVETSPVLQHPVPTAQRHVVYRYGKTPSHLPWKQNDRELRSEETVGEKRARRRTGSSIGHEEVQLWEVLGDASQEHPDHVFRRLRERHENPQEEEDESGEAIRQPTRTRARLSQADLSDSEEGEQQEVLPKEEVLSDIEEILRNHTDDFNVTTTTEYNVSSPLENSAGNGIINDTSTVIYTESEPTKNATLQNNNETDSSIEQNVTHHPIRIRAFLADMAGGGEHLSSDERNQLLQEIVRPALLSWSAALRVDPVAGNLTVDPGQLIDEETCGAGKHSGLPSVPVPAVHLTEGVPDTDMIIYISLAFAEPVETTAPSQGPSVTTGPSMMEATSSEYADISEGEQVSSTKQEEEGRVDSTEGGGDTELEDEELTIESTAAPSMAPRTECAGDYLAAATFCSTDQYDRPTAAILHICIGESFFDPAHLYKNIHVVQHELGHALGFNAQSLAHFRRADGSPITPRDSKGEIPLTEIECTGPQHEQRRRAKVTLPSEEILQFRTVRGGVRVAQVVTPSVTQIARNHFDCQELSGAELESGEFLPLSTNPGEATCLGDHWERRLFKHDVMNPVVETVNFNPRISTITLAYFADSGWYQVDLARATTAGGWGRGAGCDFVEETCIDENGQVPPKFAKFFCTDVPRYDTIGSSTDLHGCTQDLTRKAVCTIGQYDQELPPEYQYFPYEGANIGGSDPFMDYCPVYSGFSNGLCSDPQNEAVIRVNRVERIGRRNSRCLEGKMKHHQKTAFCLPIACVIEDRTLRIQIDDIWQICSKKDELLQSRSGNYITCPDPVQICPTFYCYRDCLGTFGQCDFGVGKCVCNSTACRPDEETKPWFLRPQFIDSMPKADIAESDSPLADIYVNNARALKGDRRGPLLRSWEWPVVLFGICATIAFASYVRRKIRGSDASPPSGSDPDTDDDAANQQREVTASANKDKMMATIVVDLRMANADPLGGQRDPLEGRASETDLSMTETEGAASHVTNLSAEISDLPEAEEEVEDIDTKPAAVIRRRKRVGSLC